MTGRRVVMGLLFSPRGGSAYVVRYLGPALVRAGWSVSLAVGSLGGPGDETHAPTFFEASDLHFLDYSDAARRFSAGGDAFAAPVPMHPSYEDRAGVPDAIITSVDPALLGHLSEVWTGPLHAAGADRADVFHLHHLTPQLDAANRHWPQVPVLVHLHGTEIKLLEAVAARVRLATALGQTLGTMPAAVEAGRPATDLTPDDRELFDTTRWESWRHGEFWARHMQQQAQLADHLVTVSPRDRDTAASLLGVQPDSVSAIPNAVDTERFRPRPPGPAIRRAMLRRVLVEDPRGWSESGPPGSLAYTDRDVDRMLGLDDAGVLVLSVGRFTEVKRLPLLIRAFARARAAFTMRGSLVVWGGHPGEWEGEHPVTVAAEVGTDGIYFTGWRGHDDLPDGLAMCDAVVVPSVDDSFPQVPLEAMAVGLPVIAARSGGLATIVDDHSTRPTGWLVPPDDLDALAAALVTVVNGAPERIRRGANAAAHARADLSWDSLVPRFEAAYGAASAEHRRRGGSR